MFLEPSIFVAIFGHLEGVFLDSFPMPQVDMVEEGFGPVAMIIIIHQAAGTLTRWKDMKIPTKTRLPKRQQLRRGIGLI